MTPADTIQYFVNLILVAHADKSLDPREEELIEHIRKATRAKKGDVTKARRMVDAGDGATRLVGRPSEKLRNLEDMISVHFVESQADPREAPVVGEAIASLNISGALIDEVVAAGRAQREQVVGGGLPAVCAACSAENPPGSQFCAKCGTPLGEDAKPSAVSLELTIPTWGIALEFAESGAATFDSALSYAKTEGREFQQAKKGTKAWYCVTWPQEDMPRVVKMAELMKGWRNRKVYADGQEQTWDGVFSFLWCARRREQAYRPDQYCFMGEQNELNIWGCCQAGMAWREWADWFTYGRFVDPQSFQFDKNRIRHDLQQAAHSRRFCPHLMQDYLWAAWQLFPERVVVDGRYWDYKECYGDTVLPPNAIKFQRVIDRSLGIVDECAANGVTPVGYEVALWMIGNAMQQCGRAVPQLEPGC